MKCKQTREVIDTASRHTLYSDSVTTHLSGCLDCRRHADGTASLLKLLNAQPRVEAPADFDARLSMGIARAQAESLSDQTAALLTLLKAQPRVEAPADFDFRLSAGIARAQTERLNPTGVIERAWEKLLRTVSFGQATAMAAAALVVVTVSTFYINYEKIAPATTGELAAQRKADLTPAKVAPEEGNLASVADPGRIFTTKSVGRGAAKVKPVMFRSDVPQAINNSDDASSLEKVYDPKTKKYVSPGVAYGVADSASVAMAKWGAL
jgi:hypothetical protein